MLCPTSLDELMSLMLSVSQSGGGGGGGGRIAIYANKIYNFRGTHTAYGGKSNTEYGGSGTIYVSSANETGSIFSHLYIDNNNNEPLATYIVNSLQDSGRTYIVHEAAHGINHYNFDHVTITGSGHLAYTGIPGLNAALNINQLHGDLTGFLHSSDDAPISVYESDSPFPVAFRVYEEDSVTLPSSKYNINV